jgi:hypothetical protein
VRAKGTRPGRPELGDALRQRIAAMVRDNPAVMAYRVAKVVGCDVKTAAEYASGPRSAP